MDGDKFNCTNCRFGRHCDETGTLPGSCGPAPYPVWTIKGTLDSRICLLPMVSGASREWLRLHADWKAGFLPWHGGALGQPAAYRDAMALIESTVIRLQRDRRNHG